jgi:hypothetical protein
MPPREAFGRVFFDRRIRKVGWPPERLETPPGRPGRLFGRIRAGQEGWRIRTGQELGEFGQGTRVAEDSGD